MSLIRYQPTPSDRMAALWTMLAVEDAVVLEYGPMGTAKFAARHYSNMGLDDRRLLSTHLNEDDVVMGDVSRLEQAIKAVDETRQPKVIFIVPSSILTVTGADVAGVCHYMKDEVYAKLIPYTGGGLKGDYSAGLSESYTLLIKALAEPSSNVIPNTYNILGLSAHADWVQADLRELDNLMNNAFSAKRLAVLGQCCSVDTLKAVSQAAVNIVMRAEALPAARWLEETYGTPYVYPAPYGYLSTLSWLDLVGLSLGKSPKQTVIDHVVKKHDAAKNMTLPDSQSVSIIGDYDVIVGIAQFFESLNIPLNNLICNHSLNYIEQPDYRIRHYSSEKELLAALESIHNCWVLGNELSVTLCPDDNVKQCLSRYWDRDFLPLVGPSGADALITRLIPKPL
ncbi:MAG: nitrogenase component 1 [Lachnospiraceae bacterium]